MKGNTSMLIWLGKQYLEQSNFKKENKTETEQSEISYEEIKEIAYTFLEEQNSV